MSKKKTRATAPGKVLLCGGYLVLEPPSTGFVVSISSRFHCETSHIPAPDEDNLILVHSSQFNKIERSDFGKLDKQLLVLLFDHTRQAYSLKSPSTNPYVSRAVTFGCSLFREMSQDRNEFDRVLKKGLQLDIKADNDFYSQRDHLDKEGLPYTLKSLQSLPPFIPSLRELSELRKTGLGSSAAMTTAVCASLGAFFNIFPSTESHAQHIEKDVPNIGILHALSQYVHCMAQGKIGSGFDVSAAVFGSQLYTRFSSGILESIMNEEKWDINEFKNIILDVNKWDDVHIPLSLPRGLKLLVGDVNIGSNTPSMVRDVLKWKAQNPEESNVVWQQLDHVNCRIVQSIKMLEHLAIVDAAYDSTIQALQSVSSLQWSLVKGVSAKTTRALYQLYSFFGEARAKLREMGVKSGVAIEPPEQTMLLDATMQIPGVLAAGVPGAGGFDAVFIIVLDHAPSAAPSPAQKVLTLWETWNKFSVLPLTLNQDICGIQIHVESNEL